LGLAVSQTAREQAGAQEAIDRQGAPSKESEAPPPDPTPPPWPEFISSLVAEIAEHLQTEDRELRREARAALRELGTEITGLRAIAAITPGGDRPPNEIVTRVEREIAKRAAKLKKVLDRLEKLFGKITAPRFRLALRMLQDELMGSAPDRAVIAA